MMLEGLTGITKSSYTGDDLISREQAINSWDKLSKRGRTEFDQVLMTLPSADRPTGEWVNRSLNIVYPPWERYTCSVCGKHSDIFDYCPNCGAEMGGESDG